MSVDMRGILKAFVHCQLTHLEGPTLDDPAEVAGEMLHFISALPGDFREFLRLGAGKLDLLARRRTGHPFAELNLGERIAFLERLEAAGSKPGNRHGLRRLIHDLVSQLARLGWLVIHSRRAARDRVGFSAERPEPRVEVPAPPQADLDRDYDVCIVGSGAGGSVVAARLAEERPDLSVILLEEGGFRSPHALASRDDHGLMDLYRDAGAHPAFSILDAILDPEEAGIVNVLQPRVLGGGPFVNNAIHLDPKDEVLEEWRRHWRFPFSDAAMHWALDRVQQELNPSPTETAKGARERAHVFARAADSLPDTGVSFLPNTLEDCVGCGACNLGCPFGRKIGGLGSGHSGRRPSYLERALFHPHGSVSVRTRFEVRRLRLKGARAKDAWILEGRDATRDRRKAHVRARHYVLAAGPLASTEILRRSEARPERIQNPLGTRLSGNIVLPVFGVLPTPFPDDPLGNEPGLPMCYMIDSKGFPLLETWFHYPASLAIGIPGWLALNAQALRDYRKIGACGVVVPSDNRGHAFGGLGGPHFSVDGPEFGRLLAGIAHVAMIWFEAGAERVIPATRLPLVFSRDEPPSFDRVLARLHEAVRGPGDLLLSTAHPQGGNPIGLRPRQSIVGPDFRVFGLDNVMIADASLFPAGVRRNPQKTVMALAHLAADRLVAM